MTFVYRPLLEPRTYRRLAFLLTAAPLAAVWFALLLAGWLLVGLTAITPVVIPVLMVFRSLTWLAARTEAALAHALLDVDVRPSRPVTQAGYVGRIRSVLADPGLWRQQTYLVLRMLAGGAFAIATLSGLAGALAMLAMPILYRFGDGTTIGSWQTDTLPRALLFVPAGLATLVIWAQLVRLLSAPWPRLARGFIGEDDAEMPAIDPKRALAIHAALTAAVGVLLVVVWALTSRAYFWPVWALLPLGLVVATRAWIVLVLDRPRLRSSFAGPALAIEAGAAVLLSLFFVAVWAISSHNAFWPVWPMLAFAIVLVAHALTVYVVTRGQVQLVERIGALETTRSGAVEAAEDELRRIERDLHDGAQARLVALGMSLGLAEQKFASDPEAARTLLAEARAGAGVALKELRDLARGIHPPILTDRGLEAAVVALVGNTPLQVDVTVNVRERPPASIESAAYFVVAEALANAAKHAQAARVKIAIARDVDVLVVAVIDDGRGGAQATGPGLSGIRRRVEALDGTLVVTSPAGGPTTIEGVLPCAS